MKQDCDIILLSYESPDLLKKCVESILNCTHVKSRLIIVDNASKSAEVVKYLQEVRGNENITIEKVFSEENKGFAAGMNKGMRLSEAPFVCLLNNDCIVTSGWLKEMILVASTRGDIGLVNPQSSTFGSRPGEGVTLEEHAELLKAKRGKFLELGHAIGFACLIKRAVIEHIGYLDEAYEGVCYEDTDFSKRAAKSGFISVMAEASYVFHEEQASRKSLKGRSEVYAKNKEIFEKRWGRLLRVFIIDQLPERDKELFEYYENLKGFARQGSIIEVWQKRTRLKGKFDYSKVMRHADIAVHTLSKRFISLKILWRVLTKKKKYDLIIMEKGPLLNLLRLLKPLHKAEVFSLEEGMHLKSKRGEEYSLRASDSLTRYLRKET